LELSEALWGPGEFESGIKFAEMAAANTCGASEGFCETYANIRLASLLSQIRQVDRAREVLDSIADSIKALKNGGMSAASTLVSANLATAAGNFGGAIELATAGLRKANGIGLRGRYVSA
jgi:hypothetical protein